MEITVIHGQGHKGSTYHISKMIADSFAAEYPIIHEFFMPKDAPSYCVGCFKCIIEDEMLCPDAEKVQDIVQAMEKSQLIIVDSPTYCYEMTGQLKTFFDHLAYMWMVHRPNQTMFKKVGIVVSTAAGGGAKRVTKSLAKQLFWLGVAKTYRLSYNVRASRWEEVSEKNRQKIKVLVDKTAAKAKQHLSNPTSNIKTKLIFSMMRYMHKSKGFSITDKNYWQKNGWLEKNRPWN